MNNKYLWKKRIHFFLFHETLIVSISKTFLDKPAPVSVCRLALCPVLDRLFRKTWQVGWSVFTYRSILTDLSVLTLHYADRLECFDILKFLYRLACQLSKSQSRDKRSIGVYSFESNFTERWFNFRRIGYEDVSWKTCMRKHLEVPVQTTHRKIFALPKTIQTSFSYS